MSEQIKVIGYCRVASETQSNPKANRQEQEDEIVEAAAILNLKIEAVFTDDWMSDPKHEFLDEALEYCRSHKDIRYLLITEPSRISRNLRVYHYREAQFKSIGVEIKCTRVQDSERTQHLAGMSAQLSDIFYRASITHAKELDEPTQEFMETVTQAITKLRHEQLSVRIKQGLMAKQYKGLKG